MDSPQIAQTSLTKFLTFFFYSPHTKELSMSPLMRSTLRRLFLLILVLASSGHLPLLAESLAKPWRLLFLWALLLLETGTPWQRRLLASLLSFPLLALQAPLALLALLPLPFLLNFNENRKEDLSLFLLRSAAISFLLHNSIFSLLTTWPDAFMREGLSLLAGSPVLWHSPVLPSALWLAVGIPLLISLPLSRAWRAALLALSLVDAWLLMGLTLRFLPTLQTHPTYWPTALALAQIFLLLLISHHSKQTTATGTSWPRRLIVSTLCLLGLSLFAWQELTVLPSLEGCKVGIRQEGDWSWHMAVEGERGGPRIGAFLELIKASGADLVILEDDEIADADLDIFLLIHPCEPLSEALQTWMLTFMQEGGGILVDGEHTNIHGIEEGVNSFLRHTGITLNNDSALPIGRGWQWIHRFQSYAHPVMRHIHKAIDHGLSVGGSLEVNYPARVLLAGSMAFSDHAKVVPSKKGDDMGDKRPNRDERMGGLPLIACEEVGAGRLLVIGDTSGLMSLSATGGWRGWLDMLSWLSGSRGTQAGAVRLVQKDKIVWIDYTHGSAGFQQQSDLNFSFMELATQLLERGYLPLALPDFDEELLQGSPLLLMPGPLSPLSQRESIVLKRYMEAGGKVILTADARRNGAKAFLQSHGLSLLDTPLGQAPDLLNEEREDARFLLNESWALQTTQPVDTLLQAWGYAIALEKEVGAGSLILVGDDRLFTRLILKGQQSKGRRPSQSTRLQKSKAKLVAKPESHLRKAWKETHQATFVRSSARRVQHDRPNPKAASEWVLDQMISSDKDGN
jgi:hypothetical protein